MPTISLVHSKAHSAPPCDAPLDVETHVADMRDEVSAFLDATHLMPDHSFIRKEPHRGRALIRRYQHLLAARARVARMKNAVSAEVKQVLADIHLRLLRAQGALQSIKELATSDSDDCIFSVAALLRDDLADLNCTVQELVNL
ncbi:MAG: hypothetical protein QM718_02500 [Steroidobacteraceae bacterium]